MKARLREVQDAKTLAVQSMERKATEAQAFFVKILDRERQARCEDTEDVQQLQERNTFQASLIASLRKEVEIWKWREMVDAYGRHSWIHRETRQTVFVCPF